MTDRERVTEIDRQAQTQTQTDIKKEREGEEGGKGWPPAG